MIYLSIILALNLIFMVSITKCQRCAERFDLIIMVDSSGSIRDNNPKDKSYDNWQLIKDFLSDTADLLEISEVNKLVVIQFLFFLILRLMHRMCPITSTSNTITYRL